MTAAAGPGAVATSMTPTSQLPARPMNSRPQLTTGSSAATTASIPLTAADHFDPLPQPPVHDPSGASFMEAEVSRTIRILAGTRAAGITAPQPLSGYPAAPGRRTRAGEAENDRAAAKAAGGLPPAPESGPAAARSRQRAGARVAARTTHAGRDHRQRRPDARAQEPHELRNR